MKLVGWNSSSVSTLRNVRARRARRGVGRARVARGALAARDIRVSTALGVGSCFSRSSFRGPVAHRPAPADAPSPRPRRGRRRDGRAVDAARPPRRARRRRSCGRAARRRQSCPTRPPARPATASRCAAPRPPARRRRPASRTLAGGARGGGRLARRVDDLLVELEQRQPHAVTSASIWMPMGARACTPRAPERLDVGAGHAAPAAAVDRAHDGRDRERARAELHERVLDHRLVEEVLDRAVELGAQARGLDVLEQQVREREHRRRLHLVRELAQQLNLREPHVVRVEQVVRQRDEVVLEERGATGAEGGGRSARGGGERARGGIGCEREREEVSISAFPGPRREGRARPRAERARAARTHGEARISSSFEATNKEATDASLRRARGSGDGRECERRQALGSQAEVALGDERSRARARARRARRVGRGARAARAAGTHWNRTLVHDLRLR